MTDNFRRITFVLPGDDEKARIHGGTWIIRARQARGVLSKEEADQQIKEARIKRALRRRRAK